MSKNKKAVVTKPKNEVTKVTNGLENVVLGGAMFPGSAQVQSADTMFDNIRGYLITNMRTLLSQIYIEHGIIEKAIDLPVEDGLRGGLTFKTGQLDEEEISNFQEDFLADIEIEKQAEKWKRLFGGGGVMIITDQDAETPLDMDAIKEGSPLSFKAIDLWELYDNLRTVDDKAVTEKERADEDLEVFNYYGKKVHRSRLILMKGKEAPSFVRPRLRGWGLSELECLVNGLNQYLKSTNLSFEVMDEFKLDIFKIKGFIDALSSPEGEQAVQKRVAIANMQKNYQNALSMDADDDYQQKQLSFSGLAEVKGDIRLQVASDLCIPMTKLFGQSATGFNSGEDDIENYNAMIESTIRPSAKRTLTIMAKLRMKQKFGFIPDDLKSSFQSLRMMSSEQEENVKTQKYNRLIQARQTGEITSQEFREAANKDELFPIKLDVDAIPSNPEDYDMGAKVGTEEPKAKPVTKDARVGIEPKKPKTPKG